MEWNKSSSSYLVMIILISQSPVKLSYIIEDLRSVASLKGGYKSQVLHHKEIRFRMKKKIIK
ncbi:hypothetical protein JHK86_009855 [Glycine max]|nr:hypothetical protein JHK86_009855 [Glycine max]